MRLYRRRRTEHFPEKSSRGLARRACEVATLLAALALAPSAALAAVCIEPETAGTAVLPPLAGGCEQESLPNPFQIENGLPPATTIDIEIIELSLTCSNPVSCNGTLGAGICEEVGGALGGDRECYSSALQMQMTGTGLLAGFTRTIFVPVVSEVETSPRTPGNPVQNVDARYVSLQGQLFGDPDFDQLSIEAGSDFGLPSPGKIVMTDLYDGTFQVYGFFNVDYRIDFQGAPGSILEGFSGSTQKTGRLQRGDPPAPAVPALSAPWIAVFLGALLIAGTLSLRSRMAASA